MSLPGQESPSDGSEEVRQEAVAPAARQNPILRSYFRTRFTHLKTVGDRAVSRPDPFLEDYVDRQIDHLLAELERKLTLMKANLASSLKGREAALDAVSAGEEEQARQHWKQALKGVADNAHDLWNLLRYIFTGLDEKDKSLPLVSSQDESTLYQRQQRYLEQEIQKAEQRIHRYFFQADSTVRLEDVQGKNMLIHLYRVREVAKQLKKNL